MREAKQAKVIEAAQGVFLRYGYKRVTMGDLAAAAGMSRPALYLCYCNKEEVFEATLRAMLARVLDEVRAGLPGCATLEAKLRFLFEVWAVRPFQMLAGSPDGKELLDCGFAFAREAVDQGYAAIEAELAAILAPELAGRPQAPSAEQIARVLTRAVHGFKGAARDADDLRALIDGQLALVLGALAG